MIETSRLIIRLFEIKDADDYFEFEKDTRVGLNADWLPYETKKQAIKAIKQYKKSKMIFAIELKENHKVIGKIGLYYDLPVSDFFNLTQKSLGFCISPEYWGNGYALEASKAFVEYVFKSLNIDLLWCCCFTFNHQSESVIKKLNFNFYNEIIYDATDIGKKAFANMYYMTKDKYFSEVR